MTPRNLIDEFRELKINTRAHAAYFLRHGELHPDIHFVIRESLESFIRHVEEGGPEVRAALLAAIPPEGTA